jgi:hypothetical protein
MSPCLGEMGPEGKLSMELHGVPVCIGKIANVYKKKP